MPPRGVKPGSERDAIADPWGERTPYGRGARWPEREDVHVIGDIDRWVPSASVLHSNGDGLDISVSDGRIVGVRGRVADRVNRGRLDPKDVYGWRIGFYTTGQLFLEEY